jgi:hypothetical protein
MVNAVWAGLAMTVVGLIYYFGSAGFGRSDTQRLIDGMRADPRLTALACWFDRHHGRLRASFHYVEFGGLTFVLIGLVTGGTFAFTTVWPYVVWAGACVGAYFDEVHQSRNPGRCFRRIDFLHSLMGATGMLGLLFLIDWVRWAG